MLALLAIEGEQSGYGLLKRVDRSVGHVWGPHAASCTRRSGASWNAGLARRRVAQQSDRPNKHLYRLTR